MGTRIVAAGLSAALLLSGCATTGGGTQRLETPQQRLAQCLGAAAGGALLGAVIGNNTGSGNAGRGAVTGAVVGAGLCAVWQAFDSQQDQIRIRDAQIAALRTGQPQVISYTDPGSNTTKTIQVSDVTQVSNPAAAAASGDESERLCYSMRTTLSVTGSDRNEVLNPTYCDDGAGGFEQVR